MTPNSSPLPILVVDDDAVSRMVLAGILRRLPGVEVVEAADGQEAWERLEQGLRPVICCTDVQMPRLDGLGLVKKAKAHPILSSMTVIMIAGEPDRDTVRRAREQGVAGFEAPAPDEATAAEHDDMPAGHLLIKNHRSLRES